MRIEVDLFSGQPNPGWELNPTETDEVRAAMEQLRTCAEIQPPQGLGYRGFDIIDDQRQERIHVYQGTAWFHAASGLAHMHDKLRALERALLSQAQSRLKPEVFQVLAREMALEPR